MNQKEYEEMKKQMIQDKEGRTGKFWRPGSKEEGKFPIRILPPMKKNEEKVFYYAHKTHYINGSPVECINQDLVDADGNFHKAQRCPICDFVSKLYNASEKGTDDWDLAGQLKARKRYISRIIVRGGKEGDVKVDFYEYGVKIWEKLFNILTDTEYGNILDPKNGRDFIIQKSGTGRNSDYSSSMPSANKSPIFDDNDKLLKVFNKATEMKYNDLVTFTSFDELKKMLKMFLSNEDEEFKKESDNLKNKKESVEVNDSMQNKNNLDSKVEEPELEDDEIDSILREFVS